MTALSLELGGTWEGPPNFPGAGYLAGTLELGAVSKGSSGIYSFLSTKSPETDGLFFFCL